MEGGFKVVNDIQFEDMRIGELFQVVTRLMLNPSKSLYYCLPGTTLTRDFYVEGEQDVVFQKLSIDDPFLTKLVGKGNFIGTRDNPIPSLSGKYILEENDPDDDLIDVKYKIKKGVTYPSYNPETAWDEFQPILGMKFENPLQLKNALADYGVKHGYQLWYYRSDYKSLLVYCGRDIELGRCAGKRGMKKKKKGIAKGDKGNREVKASPKKPMKWTRMGVHEHKGHHCPFRLWASWMSSERSFRLRHCTHIIAISYKFMREDIKEKYIVDVSLGKCKRAKQCALYEHDGGLIEHYGKLFYVCFKGVKDGWLSRCRKVIGIDGYFITHMCKGKLLTAMGRDGNNQMYPIAWALVDALIDVARTWLPQAEHKHCARHLYANFKKKWSGLHYKILFLGAATSTIEQDFISKMREIRALDEEASAFLMEREPATWCKAYFQTHTRCASFKNGISESFNAQILSATASECDDLITPSIRKHLEELKEKQRKWTFFPSGCQVVEVRKRDEAFGVNPINIECDCRLWNLSGFSIKPVYGSKMWRSTINTPPLPPIVKTMLGRPRKNRIKHPSEKDDEHHVSRV
ncbi:hypothetical protein Tco_0431544 [Tanacetum coccineum]